MASLPLEFSFDSRSLQLDEDSDFIARLPAGICTRAGLFEVLRRELRLPDYFGNNWDALSDCLRDLSWINQRRVAIVHAQLPVLGDNELSIYLDILAQCVDDWKAADDHQLIVVFPEIAGPVVSAIVEQRG